MRDKRTPKDVCGEARSKHTKLLLTITRGSPMLRYDFDKLIVLPVLRCCETNFNYILSLFSEFINDLFIYLFIYLVTHKTLHNMNKRC